MDDSTTIRAAAVQLSPVLFDREGTTEKVLGAIADAAKEGVQLAVFPETFIPYYPYFFLYSAASVDGKSPYASLRASSGGTQCNH